MKSVYYHLSFGRDSFLPRSGDFLNKQDMTCWVVAGAQTKVSPVLKQCSWLSLVGACCLRYRWHVKSDPGSPVWVTDLWMWRFLVRQKHCRRVYNTDRILQLVLQWNPPWICDQSCQMTLRGINSWAWFNCFLQDNPDRVGTSIASTRLESCCFFFFHAGRLSDLTCKVLQRCSLMFLTAVSKRCSTNCVPAVWQDYTRWITSSRTLQCAVARFLKRPAKGPFCWLLMVGWFESGFESIWGSAVVGLRRIMQGIWKMGGWTNGNGTPFSCRQMSQWPTMQ